MSQTSHHAPDIVVTSMNDLPGHEVEEVLGADDHLDGIRVTIVGGGIGGLAVAVALRQLGALVTVFERAPQLEPLGAGLSLWPNAVRALRSLRVADAIETAEVPRGEGGLWRWDGAPLATQDADEIASRFGAPLVLVHRGEVQQALSGALDAGTIVLGETLRTLEQDDAGIRATFESGRVAEADILVGADGLHSTTRAALIGDGPPRYSGLIAHRAVVEHPAPETAGEFWGEHGVFGLVPLSQGRVYWYATHRSDDPDIRDDKDRLLDRLATWIEPIPQVVERTPAADILRHPLFDRRPCRGWSVGRATLVGDAAHPMLPFLGQGACQAIEDAVALRDELGWAVPISDALRAYEERRYRRVTMLVKRSRAAGRVAHLSAGWQRAARDAALRHTPARLQRRQLDATIGLR